ncbi:MAG: isoprenylcysteine carboxylmethyltransferase family protein [bacterium]|nr:isoprenylcysteine carboxylmethyltransferase family protein [bacterium]
MNIGNDSGYGLWWLAAINTAIFIIFALSFTRPKTKHEWRSFGTFSAFIVALFTEMYGFPLTIYLLSGWLIKRFPRLDLYSHNNGHLWETLFGLKGDPHMNIIHIISILVIGGGFMLIINSWHVLYRAQRVHQLAISGPYSYIRHPQYLGFILIMLGFLLQWPTLPTFIMFPILIIIYTRLAKKEEQDSLREFGDEYRDYLRKVPAFLPDRSHR